MRSRRIEYVSGSRFDFSPCPSSGDLAIVHDPVDSLLDSKRKKSFGSFLYAIDALKLARELSNSVDIDRNISTLRENGQHS